jgi:cytoskeletal protein CcmA (bactofilin family)
MFNEKKGTKSESNLGLSNRILQSTIIKGEVISETDIRIDGTLEGSIQSKGKVVIGKSGLIDGKVICANADVEGTFKGNIHVSGLLTLKSSAHIEGEVETAKLAIEPGAQFNATCSMKNSGIKSINNSNDKEKKSAAS